jgi:eukaryotic-like serine/threonine-protein kinase
MEKAMSREEKVEQLLARWDELREEGREVTAEELAASSPELLDELKGQIQKLQAMNWLDQSVSEPSPSANGQARLGAAIPEIIGGRYRLERLIAEGGFGQVWRATDTALQRPVAVKVTTLECVSEARRVASLKHHGIVSVHDVGHEGDHCFIVFDLVEGTDLDRRIKASRLGWEDAARLVAEVAAHLHYAHEMGFVHRDIKPANILLDEKGRPVLADFGIAVTECELRHEAMTSMGTLAYMAPEQLTAGGRVDARTDVYGLGVVLYELLTGSVPFADPTLTGLRQRILSEDPRPVRSLNGEVPPDLERLCMKCLSKEATDRYGSARALAEALTAFLKSK